jgi:DNA-binding MarR family transcriptional regulator
VTKNDVHKIRAFNRFYTRVIRLLDKYLLDSRYTLPEVRTMYEIHNRKKITSREIIELLGMDKGYLSRMLLGFDKKGLIRRKSIKEDGRVQEVSLTKKGEKDFLEVNRAADEQIITLISRLTKPELQELTSHMEGIRKILSKIGERA